MVSGEKIQNIAPKKKNYKYYPLFKTKLTPNKYSIHYAQVHRK